MVCYVDVDHFKPFNDLYGYAKGDEILLCLAHCLDAQIDSSRDFIGHIGGDDFMLVMRSEDWSERISQLFETFEQRCRSVYRADHLAEGCFIAEGRQGGQQHYPLLSLSVGAVFLRSPPTSEIDAASLAALASEAKRQATQIAGFSLYTIDTEQRPLND